MVCTLEELRRKDVINVQNGENLGKVDDLELDGKTAAVTALILFGQPRFFGIFGPRDNCIIGFQQIRLIGKDAILVDLGIPSDCAYCTNSQVKSKGKFYARELDHS